MHRNSSILGSTLGIVALFLTGFFLLIIVGANGYKATIGGQNSNSESRALLSYFSTTMKAYDRAGAVSVETLTEDEAKNAFGEKAMAGETQMLVIRDATGSFGLFIYPYDGKLLEEYTSLNAARNPNQAQVIGETSTFSIEENDGLYRITTDAGEIMVQLRSSQEGAGS